MNLRFFITRANSQKFGLKYNIYNDNWQPITLAPVSIINNVSLKEVKRILNEVKTIFKDRDFNEEDMFIND